MIRIGTVTNVYPENGKVKVYYEDTESSSLPLPMVSMNREQSMPDVGDTVITLHMTNGSSQGFCIGTYFDDDYEGSEKYTKEFDDKAFVECDKGNYRLACEDITLESKEINLKCEKGNITLSELLKKLDEYEKRIKVLESKL
nr:MAG TPA: baseplate assembly protein [Caudoviricetes sp.]